MLSDVVAELARLSDRASIPELTQAVSFDIPLTPEESFIVSLLGTNIDVAMLLTRSPLSEDETLQFLARLITTGIVSIPSTRR